MSDDVICRGSYALGTACGHCKRCAEERAQILAEKPGWLHGKLSISRPSGGGREHPVVTIDLRDELSRCQFLEVEIDPASLTLALTGKGEVPCWFRLRTESPIGQRAETKTEELWMNAIFAFDRGSKRQEAYFDKLLQPYEVDGWKARRSDLTNSHNTVRRDHENRKVLQRVVFFRHVPVNPEEPCDG